MSEERRAIRGGCASGRFVPPGSKSIGLRALLTAGLGEGRTTLVGLPSADDVRHGVAALANVGAPIERAGAVQIEGRRPWDPRRDVEAGESGTLARFLLALLSLHGTVGEKRTLRTSGTLTKRSSSSLLASLARLGVELQPAGPGALDLRLTPIEPPERLEIADPVSSQEVSALLLAAAAFPSPREVVVRGTIPSAPYVAMTRAVLSRFGVHTEESVLDERRSFAFAGSLRAPSAPLSIEPDASLAAVALAAACLSGGELEVPGLGTDSIQGDARGLEHFRALGWTLERGTSTAVRGGEARAARLELGATPDLAPVFAVLAARAAIERGEASRLDGLGTLPGKESDRLAGLAEGLAAVGLETAIEGASLIVGPGAQPKPALLDARRDHRMAFAFALLGLVVPGTEVTGGGCVAKSWPRFWDDLRAMGLDVA